MDKHIETLKQMREKAETNLPYWQWEANTALAKSRIDALTAAIDQLEANRWRLVEDGLPERRLNVRYSQVPCIVIRDGHPEMLVFNHEHECWDDATGDDFDCKPDEVEAWMPVPTFEGEKK